MPLHNMTSGDSLGLVWKCYFDVTICSPFPFQLAGLTACLLSFTFNPKLTRKLFLINCPFMFVRLFHSFMDFRLLALKQTLEII